MEIVTAIIVAAGEGKRFGSPKQFSFLKGKPVLEWSLRKFETHEGVDEIILVLKGVDQKAGLFKNYRKIVGIVEGGKKRQDSVIKGFNQIDPEKGGIVLVHDGVRPLVQKDLISRIIKATSEKGAAIPAIPVEDTVKEVERQEVIRTMDRERLFRVQTPQGFSYSVLKEALERTRDKQCYSTDEASLVERTGKKVFVVQGDPKNIKITTPEDLRVAEVLFED